MKKQKTITKEITFEGIGIHSGENTKIILIPAETNYGIIFLKNNIKIEHNISNVEYKFLCTEISQNNQNIKTVEHLLSALYALEITNLKIFVEGDEIPILDGSAYDFIQGIQPHIKEQKETRTELKLNKILTYSSQEKFIIAIPSNKLKINYILDYDDEFPFFYYYSFTLENLDSYINEISKARTFGFLKDKELIFKYGIAKGTNDKNTVLIDKNSYYNSLRYPNEIIRHKILDFIGDLSFVKKYLKAEFFCYKTGHKEHLEIVKKMLSVGFEE